MGNVMMNVPAAFDQLSIELVEELGMETVRHGFAAAEMNEWKGYDGKGPLQGVWDRLNERIYTV